MTAAVDILSESKAAGVELYLDNGRLRYRAQPGAYTEGLRQKVATCRDEIIAELSSQGGFIHWSKLTPESREAIIPTIKAGQPVRIFSEVLGEVVYWVRDHQAVDELKRQGITEVCYTLVELRELAGQGPEFLRDIHRLKKEFGATLARTEPKPVL